MKLFLFVCGIMCSVWAAAEDAIWIDVRTAGEYQSGHIESAANIPHNQITEKIAELQLEKDTPILLYCRSGRRAGFALEALEKLGYSNVTNIGGLEDARDYLKQ